MGKKFNFRETFALFLNVVMAGGLAYALMLVGQVMNADEGTQNAGDRPGRTRRSQRLSLPPV